MIKKGINRRLAEIGKIKIGGKGAVTTSKNGKKFQLPVKYDHFVITTTEKGKDGNYVINELLMHRLGDSPKEIKIRLMFDDIDLNFYTSYAFYDDGKKCLCRGDGETANMTFQKAGTPSTFTILEGDKKVNIGDTRKIICDPDTCPMMQPDSKGVIKCKPNGVLSCILVESPEIGGVYRFRTCSWNTISNILSSLEMLKTHSGGILVGLPLKLQLLKKSTEEHGNVSVVNIAFDGEDYQKMRELAYHEQKNRVDHNINMRLIEQQAIEAGFTADNDDPEDIVAEFYTVKTMDEQPENIKDRVMDIVGNIDDEPETVEETKEEAKHEEKSTATDTISDGDLF